jgi:ssDNA-binding Zn-finger/Zn-ribbon topoisomerase 1
MHNSEDKEVQTIQTKQCKTCQKIKVRISDGSYNAKDKRWRDSEGELWNGLNCPTCHKNRMVLKMREKRAKK